MPPSALTMTSTTNALPRTTRADYHKEALHQIRASLQPFAHGGPRERLSPVVCGAPDWTGPLPPPTPPRNAPQHITYPPYHHQYPQYHTPQDVVITTSAQYLPQQHAARPSTLAPTSEYNNGGVPSGATRLFAFEPPPPPPPRVPSSHMTGAMGPPSSPPPQGLPPLLSRLSPGPGKSKAPPGHNYVNVNSCSGGSGPGRSPVIVSHSSAGMGPPPPYPTQSKPTKAPPPYPSRQSPAAGVDRSSPASGVSGPLGATPPVGGTVGATPPPGGSLGPGAMALALIHPQQQQQGHQQQQQGHQQQQQQGHQQQASYGQTARQAKTPTPVIMQSVRSTQVQKPILQTAVAPPSPPPTSTSSSSAPQQQSTQYTGAVQQQCTQYTGAPQQQSTQYTGAVQQHCTQYTGAPQQQCTHYTGSSLSSSSSASTLTPSAAATPPPPPPYTPTSSPFTLPPTSSPFTLPPTSSPFTLPPTSSPFTLPPTSSPFTLPSSSPYPLPSPSPSPSPATPPVPSVDSPVPQFDPPSYHSTMMAKAAATAARGSYNSSYTNQRHGGRGPPSPAALYSNSPSLYSRGSTSPALTSIPLQENPVQELDLSSTPLACIPIDSLSDGNTGALSSTYSECDGPPPSSALGSRLNRVMADTPSTASPRSASPVSSVTSHDTHALSPSPVSCLSTATSSPSTQSDVTLESGYSSSSQSAVRGMLAPPPPTNVSSLPPSQISNSIKGNSNITTTVTTSSNTITNMPPPPLPPHKTMHQSPIPERKKKPPDQDTIHPDNKVKYSSEAYKFYIEQRMENVIKSAEQRKKREQQLENEMKRIGLCPKDQLEMRKVLIQKESNFIRLKRAKMNKSMFHKLKTIGVGAFGEVALVRKYDCTKLYAMKTLRKSDVIKRNQVAHVKAERDILAESDNDWVVKLYYSFQDTDNLYLIMDYIPGGDLMSLLIKFGIFKEPLARFYIAELVCAIESVHKIGFIHRDIKPDNILIDRDGHIKLTDFGLCTGFRWTHNSRYYQRKGEHSRQESMDPCGDNDIVCRCNDLKPLERRRRRQHLRCMAHSLVGTPNYIAPEVLAKTGYSQLCDWWSVGVILYEMLVGQPPFLANTPAETQCKVLNWESCLRIPKQASMTPEAKDLILRLCSGPETRLGRNALEIKNHGFFSEVNFDAGLRKQRALYIPEIKHSTDTSNFDPIEPDRLRSDTDSDADWLNSNQPIHGFFEFTYRRFFDSTPSSGGVNVGGASGSSLGAGGTAAHSPEDKDGQHPVYV